MKITGTGIQQNTELENNIKANYIEASQFCRFTVLKKAQ
jgi:hypothetical protein